MCDNCNSKEYSYPLSKATTLLLELKENAKVCEKCVDEFNDYIAIKKLCIKINDDGIGVVRDERES